MPVTLWLRFISLVEPGVNETFVNYTNLTTVELNLAWMEAQNSLATQPFPLSSGGPLHAADPKALTISAKNVTVVACPDEPVSNLVKVNPAWTTHKDPSGTILESIGFSYQEVHSIACCWTRPRVYAAASELSAVLVYEFSNIILSQLGYDVSAR